MAEKRVVVADPTFTVPLLINGKEVEVSDSTFPVISPASQKELWKSSSANLEHVKSAASAAQAAFPSWSKMKPAAKRAIFMKAADIVDARAAELAEYMKLETGAASPFADGFNVPKAADMLRDVAGRLSTITGSIPTCESEGTSALIVKEPLGTVLAIAPW
jgi:acyl-CoA reductase-like NAD-dependent aldehyde dehydrogenase